MSAQKYKVDLGTAISQDMAPEVPEPEQLPKEDAPPKASAERAGALPISPPEPMSAEEIAAVPKAERKQLNISPPRQLDLHRRAALYRMAHGVDIQDQGTIALDTWLREQGF